MSSVSEAIEGNLLRRKQPESGVAVHDSQSTANFHSLTKQIGDRS